MSAPFFKGSDDDMLELAKVLLKNGDINARDNYVSYNEYKLLIFYILYYSCIGSHSP
jgi:hypothetical protein